MNNLLKILNKLMNVLLRFIKLIEWIKNDDLFKLKILQLINYIVKIGSVITLTNWINRLKKYHSHWLIIREWEEC